MPSLISGYEYEIFISYRHKDNKSDGWVTEFVRTLRSELEATFKEDISIYFDENPHDGLLQHHEVDDSLREKLRCLILIPIVSQTYCDPKAFAWQHELLAFIKLASEDKLGLKTKVGGGNTASRVLPVRIHEVDTQDKKLFEEATGGVMRPIDFIYKESGVNRPLRPTDNRDRNQVQTDYRNQVNKVANAIKDIITGLRGTEEGSVHMVGSGEKSTSVSPVQKTERKWKLRIPDFNAVFGLRLALIGTLVALIIVTVFHFSETAPVANVFRYELSTPENTTGIPSIGLPIALSPDGSQLAFVANDSTGKTLLWVRPLHAFKGHALSGTDGASSPFWSPDSQFIGFFADGKLKKIDASGGPPQTICLASNGRGGTWNDSGTIVFCPSSGVSSLFRVSAVGGSPVRVTKLDTSLSQFTHRWPHFLPDGKHFLYTGLTSLGSVSEKDAIYLGSLDTTFIPRVLSKASGNAAYGNGYLLHGRSRDLIAQPFDMNSLQITGAAFPIVESVHTGTGYTSIFTISKNGILAYRGATSFSQGSLFWFDRMGKQAGSIDQNFATDLRMSQDKDRIAVSVDDGKVADIWLYKVSRAIWTRLTFEPGHDRTPIWSPDGTTIVYASQKSSNQVFNLFQRASSGEGSEKVLFESNENKTPADWSLDGKFLAYTAFDPGQGNDIWILSMNAAGTSKPFPFLQTEFSEQRPTFSPDGRWIAYESTESGSVEVYLRPFPGPGAALQISSFGGSHPRWRHDGKELFFRDGNERLNAIEIKLGSTTVNIGSSRPLFHMPAQVNLGINRPFYDVSADGQHFLFASQVDPDLNMKVVVNWPEEVRK